MTIDSNEKRPKAKLFKEPQYAMNPQGYLCNKQKLVLVQIGQSVFALKEFGSITIDNIEQMLEKYDIRLLKDGEY